MRQTEGRSSRRGRRAAARRRRLVLECLEERSLLASFVVDSLGDLGDANPTDGVPRDSTGKATLRAVIEHINRLGGSHSISFAVGGSIGLESSLPVITPTVEIDGRGSDGQRVQVTRAATAPGSLIGTLVLQGAGSFVHDLAPGSLQLMPSATNSRIEGNYVGVSRDGTTAISGSGILVQSSGNRIGGTTAATRNVTTGIYLSAGGNTVIGNHVGVNADGTAALTGMSSLSGGIQVTDGTFNVIGGLEDGEFNVVGGVQAIQGDNAGAGIFVGGGNFAGTPRNTQVIGNRVGTNRAGTAAIPNRVGIQVTNVNATEETRIEYNMISGNLNKGIDISAFAPHTTTNVQVKGNKIGLSLTGTALGNRMGITIAGASGNVIGGDVGEDDKFLDIANIISANGPVGSPYFGIGVAFLCTGLFNSPCNQFSHDNRIASNVIGSSVPGLGNAGIGVLVTGGNLRNRIDNNAIVDNGGSGVYLLDAERTTVASNGIARNRASGVVLAGNTHDNVIGGTEAGAGNNIVSNAFVGVTMFASGSGTPAKNAILGNNIVSSGFLGIDLGNNNQTLNDLGNPALCPTQPAQCPDADTGPNALQNAPEITRLNDQQVRVVLDSVPNTRFRIEVFSNTQPDPTGYGEGETFLEAWEVTTNSAGHASVDRTLAKPLGGRFVAATATRIENNVPVETSEFSGSLSFVVNSTLDLPDNNPGDGKIEIGAPGSVRTVMVDGQSVNMVTLRAALMEANELPGAQIITFGIPTTDAGFSGGVYTIRPAVNDSPVDQEDVTAAKVQLKITDTVLLDATTQTGFDTVTRQPVIRLDGSSPTAGEDGLRIETSGATVRGLVINRFRGDAIDIVQGSNNIIEGNYLGLHASGTAATAPDGTSMRNGGYGVYVHGGSENVVGGITAAAANVISGNLAGGVRIDGAATDSRNRVRSNRIGVDRTGGVAVPNGSVSSPAPGVHVHGGNDNVIGGDNAGNLIAGNTGDGVLITGGAMSTYLEGNLIGIDLTGQLPLGNGQSGVRIGDFVLGGATSTLVGGNTISANHLAGVQLRGSDVSDTRIVRNRIGTTQDGNSAGTVTDDLFALGNQLGGIRVEDARRTLIGDSLDGNVIGGNRGDGILLMDTTPEDAQELGGQILMNKIGVSLDGRTPLGNSGDGVRIVSARRIVVGGLAEDGNLISGNGGAGVHIVGYTGSGGDSDQHVLVAGNLLGTDAAGTGTGREPVSSRKWGQSVGILVEDSSGNTLGYAPFDSLLNTRGEGNVIAGNRNAGIRLSGANSTRNRVAGNLIGVDRTGMVALSDQDFGIYVQGRDNVIGGPTVAERNLIAGSALSNIIVIPPLAGPTPLQNNRIIGNYVGVDVTGLRSLGGAQIGIELHGARGNHIGGGALDGDRRSEANVIGGFSISGVQISLAPDDQNAANEVIGNYIGVAPNGTSLCGAETCASGDGISLYDSSGNVIGGTGPTAGNVIAFNGGVGVLVGRGVVRTTERNAILGNSIYSNGRLGIDLKTPVEDAQGVSHDTTEISSEPWQANRNQRAPLLTTADRDPTTARVTVTGELHSATNATYRIEVFASQAVDPSGFGEGQRLIHTVNVTTDALGQAALTLLTDGTAGSTEFITATATKLEVVNGVSVPTNSSEFSNALQLGSKFIRGVIYLDNDGNARRDGGGGSEPGIPDWPVRLIQLSTGAEVGSMRTRADGSYRFPVTATGDYRIETETRAHWLTTTGPTAVPPDSARVTVGEVPTPSIDFGKFAEMQVEGEVFDDLNVDGDRDPGEPLVAGVGKIKVDLPGTVSDREQSLASSGSYLIDQIGPGEPLHIDPMISTELEISGSTYREVQPLIRSVPVRSGLPQTVHFAVMRPMSVEVLVFHDRNGDGVRQAADGEDLLDPWTVELDLHADGTSDSPGPGTTTGGRVLFSNIGAGNLDLARVLTVQVLPQVGWSQTTVTPVWTMASGGSFQAVIGQTRTGEIHGFKFEDLDANGTYESGERPLPNITFNLSADTNRDGTGDRLVATVSSGEDGVFSFTNLPPGQYVVTEVVPVGMRATANATSVIDLKSAQSIMAEPGLVPLGSGLTSVIDAHLLVGDFVLGAIHGYKFQDLDGQGIDNGDPRVDGVTITLRIDANKDGNFEAVQTTTTTAPNGYYQFTNLGPGRYQVVETVPAGQVQTTTAPDIIDLRSGEVWVAQGGMAPVSADQVQMLALRLAFGNFQLVTLSGRKFLDRNANGTLDPGEPGLAGWTIQLDRDNDGTIEATVVTGQDGSYAFSLVGPGRYGLTEVQRPFFAATAPPGGRHLVTTESGRNVGNLLFGNRTFQAVIAGTVYQDLDGDGVRDDDDPHQAGVTVYIDANNDGRLNHENSAFDNSCGAGSQEICWITDDSGEYAFPMPVGTYLIRQIVPTGFSQTQPAAPGFYQVEVFVDGETLVGYDFGNQRQAGAVHGRLDIDLTGDGSVPDDWTGEQVGLTLRRETAPGVFSPVADIQSEVNGEFHFLDVAAGTYDIVTSDERLVPRRWSPFTVETGEVWMAYDGQVTTSPNDTVVVESQLRAGVFFYAEVLGYVFDDLDLDKLDSGEPRTPDMVILLEIDSDGDGSVDDFRTTTTNAQGEYRFDRLEGQIWYSIFPLLAVGHDWTNPAGFFWFQAWSGDVWLPEGLQTGTLASYQFPVIEPLLAIGQTALTWTNPEFAIDVSADRQITPLDALLIINQLNEVGGGPLSAPADALDPPPPYLDVNGDGQLTPLDALLVVNYLNQFGGGPIPGGEGEATPLGWVPVPEAAPSSLDKGPPAAAELLPFDATHPDPARVVVRAEADRRWPEVSERRIRVRPDSFLGGELDATVTSEWEQLLAELAADRSAAASG